MSFLPLFDTPDPLNLDDELWAGDNEWVEVPQSIFLSWPPQRQAVYQAARDRNAAVYANDDWWTDFFIRRSRSWGK